MLYNQLTSYFLNRVERKERARLKTVKFNAKPGSFESKGVSTLQSGNFY